MKYAYIEKTLVMDLKRANPSQRPDTPADYFNTDFSITQMSVVFSTSASCDTLPPCSSSPLSAAATFSASAAESGVTNPSAGGAGFRFAANPLLPISMGHKFIFQPKCSAPSCQLPDCNLLPLFHTSHPAPASCGPVSSEK